MSLGLLRFGKYSLVGSLTFALDLALLYALVETFSFNPSLAAGAAFLVGVSINYLLSRRFVFTKTTRDLKVGYYNFLLIAGFGVCLVMLGMHFILTTLHWNYLIARVAVATISGLWNYLMNLFVNFNVAGKH